MPASIDARLRLVPVREKLAALLRTEVFPLEKFLVATSNTLSAEEVSLRSDVLDGVSHALEGLYVHLPFKRSRYGANPIDRFRALARNLPLLTDLSFNSFLLEIFRDLHDPHTTYYLPEPYKSATAFLPFLIEDCYDHGEARYVVTRVSPHFQWAGFRRGVQITHWNGMPMEMAVSQLAQRENGANPAARLAFAIASMTVRPLRYQLPPDDPTVMIRFTTGGQDPRAAEMLIDWSVFQKPRRSDPAVKGPATRAKYATTSDSKNLRNVDTHDVRRVLFSKPLLEEDVWAGRELDGAVSYKFFEPDNSLRVGIIRLRSFDWEHTSFMAALCKVVEEMRSRAPLALLLDVRGNSGGNIWNGEELLQLFCPGPITPAYFQFLNTPLARRLAAPESTAEPEPVAAATNPFAMSLELAKAIPLPTNDFRAFGLEHDTGALYSRAAQITSAAAANQVGQRYFGRVALITDAMCYSTTDIFAGGFQDHRIGPVVGVDDSTGGGGANVWFYSKDLEGRDLDHGQKFPPLPAGSEMGVSVRHCLRTGRFNGDILEDFGVAPDHRYLLSKIDLLEGNDGLYDFAFSKLLYGESLKEINVDLQVKIPPPDPAVSDPLWHDIKVYFQTTGIQLCELLINDKVVALFDALEGGYRGEHSACFSKAMGKPKSVELKCYRILAPTDFPFYPDQEVQAIEKQKGKGQQAKHLLVASRKLSEGASDWTTDHDTGADDFPPGDLPPKRPPVRKGNRLLYFVRGCGREDALASLAIVDRLKQLRPDTQVQFVSYGTGAHTLKQHGVHMIDLELPDHPPLFALERKIPSLLKRLLPTLVAAHGEFDVAPAAWPLGLPCVALTDWFASEDDHCTRAKDFAKEVLFLDEQGTFEEPKCLAGAVQYVGPILRPLRYPWSHRLQARRDAGLPANALIVSMFAYPGRRTEWIAPLSQLLTDAFALLKGRAKLLLLDRDAGPDFDLIMAASDLVITKGDRSLVLELAAIGVPTISVSHGLNGIDDLRTSSNMNPSLANNQTVYYTDMDPTSLADLMRQMIADGKAGAFQPHAFADGAGGAAMRLSQLLPVPASKRKRKP